MKTGWWRSRWFKRAGLTLIGVFTLLVLWGLWANIAAGMAASGKLYDDPDKLPDNQVGLLFGCDDRIEGRENLYFRYRINATVELWRAGKLRCVIASGSGESVYYNEPERMMEALVEAGMPADIIICDYAGLRTLDSVVRAKEVFGAEEVIFISQQFQNERAAYLAKANGLKFTGYNAQDVEGFGGLRTKIRELGARMKMWLDVRILQTRPSSLEGAVTLP